MVDLRSNEPLWPQIVEIMTKRIRSGQYEPGERIPSVLELSAEFHVTPVTVRKAIGGLRDAGLIVTHIGMGSYVANKLP
ncbi:GntR family transcriptional regulator [Streptosporangium subroseum]|uniref:GntR family transcriptional regulator n=1 Tax=Streptosporangium subroseum TaxID=106412 RepID=UPI001C5284B8|nr:GntR family transcriptional regulator [Streptosporangium subroseum]